MSELFPACFSCSKNFNLLHNSLGSDHKHFVMETPEAETKKPGDLNNFISVRSPDLLILAFTSKFISFANSYNNFLSGKLARSTLQCFSVIILKRSLFNSNCLFVPRNVNNLLC